MLLVERMQSTDPTTATYLDSGSFLTVNDNVRSGGGESVFFGFFFSCSRFFSRAKRLCDELDLVQGGFNFV